MCQFLLNLLTLDYNLQWWYFLLYSLNPTIDIGQVEGAFVMGLGCYLLEDIKYDAKTGRVMNDGTWVNIPKTNSEIHGIYIMCSWP